MIAGTWPLQDTVSNFVRATLADVSVGLWTRALKRAAPNQKPGGKNGPPARPEHAAANYNLSLFLSLSLSLSLSLAL